MHKQTNKYTNKDNKKPFKTKTTMTPKDKTLNAIKAVLDETLMQYLALDKEISSRCETDSYFFGSEEYIDMTAERLYLGKKHTKLTDALTTIIEWL